MIGLTNENTELLCATDFQTRRLTPQLLLDKLWIHSRRHFPVGRREGREWGKEVGKMLTLYPAGGGGSGPHPSSVALKPFELLTYKIVTCPKYQI